MTVRAASSLMNAVAGLLGGTLLIPIFCLIILAAAVMASPFGIMFSNEPSPGAVPLNAAVSQINMELTDKLAGLQTEDYDAIDIQGQPPDWREGAAVFASKTAGAGDGVDVAALIPDRVDRLKTVFWDMCAITAGTETVDHPASGDSEGWTEKILHITIAPKAADGMRTQYAFSKLQNDALTELLAEADGLGALLGDLSAGCSAVAWETADGGHLWGRNFDFNRIAADSKVTFVPRGQVFYACGTELEGNLEPSTRCTAAYAAVGIGSLVLRSTPALYEGLNEKGLMGGQLYYRTFAHFAPEARPGTLPLQPPFLVTWCLATCASVEEVARALEERVSLVAIPMLGTVPPIHWMFSDRTGESIVVESDRDGLHIYRNTVGVMTNSPGYPWHRTNLLNHPQLRPLDYGELAWGGERLEPCFSGSGAAGLPGDWSSPSRLLDGPEHVQSRA
mgnify:CR=1 FL=1